MLTTSLLLGTAAVILYVAAGGKEGGGGGGGGGSFAEWKGEWNEGCELAFSALKEGVGKLGESAKVVGEQGQVYLTRVVEKAKEAWGK